MNLNNFDKKGLKVVDLGCGSGGTSRQFKNADYVGIDYSRKMISSAKKAYIGKNIKFMQKDLSEKLSYEADLVLILGMFEDETDPFGRIKDLKYKKLIFTLHNQDSLYFRLQSFLKHIFVRNNFPYTSFTAGFVKRRLSGANVYIMGPSIVVEIENEKN